MSAKKSTRPEWESIIHDPDMIRSALMVVVFVASILGLFVVDVPEEAATPLFMLALIGCLAFRLMQDLVRGTIEGGTFILPFSAAACALIATAIFGIPFIEWAGENQEDAALLAGLVSSTGVLIFYMLLDGIFGPKEASGSHAMRDGKIRASPAKDDDFSHLDGESPGWGIELANHPHRYWVTYTFAHYQGGGDGACSVARTEPITCHYDVMSMADLILAMLKGQYPQLSGIRVSVKSWQRYEHPEKPPGSRDDAPIEDLPKNVIAIGRARAA